MLNDEREVSVASELYEQWSRPEQLLGDSQIGFVGEEFLTPEQILRTVLYGKYFHSDEDKRELLSRFGDNLPMIEHEFMRIVHVMTAIIRNLGWLLDLMVK